MLALAPVVALSACGLRGDREGVAVSANGGRAIVESTATGRTTGAINAASPSPPDSALLAYIANEGVMLVAGGKTVLIDALFRDGVSGYETIGNSMQDALERGTGPFEGVELVLASHHHPDHFDPMSVLRHLTNNPAARFVSTRQAAALLEATISDESRDAAVTWTDGADPTAAMARVSGVWPEEGRDTVVSLGDIELRVLNLHHGRDFDPPVENLGLLVNSGGFKALHVGDTEAGVEDFKPYRLADEGIHLALLPYWKLLEEEGVRIVQEIGAERVAAIHVPAAGAPTSWFVGAETREALVSELERNFSGLIVLDEPGESHRIGYWRRDRPEEGGP